MFTKISERPETEISFPECLKGKGTCLQPQYTCKVYEVSLEELQRLLLRSPGNKKDDCEQRDV